MDVFWQAPPVSRTLSAAACLTSLLGHTGWISLYPLVYNTDAVFKIWPEIWRLATPFLITGPQLGILLDPFFLYRYGSSLESESPRFSQPGDFFTYTVFIMLSIVLSSGLFLGSFWLPGAVFLPALTLAFAYTYSQDNPNAQSNFIIISFSAKYLPYAMLFMTYVQAGWYPTVHQATGIFAAHLYDFLTRIWPAFGGASQEPWVKTPDIIAHAFGANHAQPRARGYGTAMNPSRDPPAAAAAARNVWGARGPGHRLG